MNVKKHPPRTSVPSRTQIERSVTDVVKKYAFNQSDEFLLSGSKQCLLTLQNILGNTGQVLWIENNLLLCVIQGVVKLKMDVLDDDEDEGYDFVDHYEYQYINRQPMREIDSTPTQLALHGSKTTYILSPSTSVFCFI